MVQNEKSEVIAEIKPVKSRNFHIKRPNTE
jgi:hypothetical protein